MGNFQILGKRRGNMLVNLCRTWVTGVVEQMPGLAIVSNLGFSRTFNVQETKAWIHTR